LSHHTTQARIAYQQWKLHGEGPAPELAFPIDWVVDESRDPEIPATWQNSIEYVGQLSRGYARDLWQDQGTHCEVWSEKGTVLGSLRPIAQKWGFTVRVCHGFGSTSMAGQIASEFQLLHKQGKRIKVYYVGDHDASGVDIERDLHSRSETLSNVSFEIVRLAIFAEDIKKFNVPPQTIKPKDSRAPSFEKKYGKGAATVELDALPVEELRRRVEKAIIGEIDFDTWNRQKELQDWEVTQVQEHFAKIENILRGRA